jgi:hypothetical protein
MLSVAGWWGLIGFQRWRGVSWRARGVIILMGVGRTLIQVCIFVVKMWIDVYILLYYRRRR